MCKISRNSLMDFRGYCPSELWGTNPAAPIEYTPTVVSSKLAEINSKEPTRFACRSTAGFCRCNQLKTIAPLNKLLLRH